VFAPAAAWLARGKPAASFGHAVHDPVTFAIVDPRWEDNTLVGAIEYVDRFGNLISNITVNHLQEFRAMAGQRQPTIHVGPCVIDGLVTAYSEGRQETPSALINSCGKVEIFLDRHNAAQRFNIDVGAQILLRTSQ
jgi:S-adenosylmethionine hydrolase